MVPSFQYRFALLGARKRRHHPARNLTWEVPRVYAPYANGDLAFARSAANVTRSRSLDARK